MTPDVTAMLDALESGAPHVFRGIDVVACRVDGTDMLFCVDREEDPIQRNNRAGKFYEAPELRWIGQRVKPGATFIDIGANIGNHGLYFARKLGAARVIPIEPNPVALRLLTANVVLNGVRDAFDLGFLGVGLSSASATGFAVEKRDRNIGGTKMLAGKGDIAVHAGDELFRDVTADVIKLDVEGMELDVLAGLEATIRRCRPVLLIEVDTAHDDAFHVWIGAHRYEVVKVWQRYRNNKNYLLTPA